MFLTHLFAKTSNLEKDFIQNLFLRGLREIFQANTELLESNLNLFFLFYLSFCMIGLLIQWEIAKFSKTFCSVNFEKMKWFQKFTGTHMETSRLIYTANQWLIYKLVNYRNHSVFSKFSDQKFQKVHRFLHWKKS